MESAFLLTLARVAPIYALAPLPAPAMVRIALVVLTVGWIGPSEAELSAVGLALEAAAGLALGLVLMLTGESARAAGHLVEQREDGSFGPLFTAVFWLLFLSGPHLVWLRALSVGPSLAMWSVDGVARAVDATMATITYAAAPLLATYTVLHVLRIAMDRAFGAPGLRASLEPVLLAAVLVFGLHVTTGHIADHTAASVQQVVE